jgi:hypothetical protein
MTKNEFEQIISENYRFNNRLNSITAIVLIIIGIAFLLYLAKNGISINSVERHSIIIGTIGILTLPLLPIIGGILVLNHIPKQYKVIQLISNKSTKIKEEIFYESISCYKMLGVEKKDNFYILYCRNKFYSRFSIHLYIDNEHYLYNVLSHDLGGGAGVYDLGLAKRVSKKIMASLQQRV